MAKSSRRGITLVELLVVIAILSVLAAIIMPVYINARENARKISCLSNLRQIGIAFNMYVQDWDGYYPNTNDPFLWMGRKWRWPLKSYLTLVSSPDPTNPWLADQPSRDIILCPSDTTAMNKWDNTSYAYSMSFYHTPEQINAMTQIEQTWTDSPECISQAESSVKYPAKKVLVTEWLSLHELPHVGWNNWEGGRILLFADGHCRYMKARSIIPANDGWPDPNLTIDGIEGKDIE